ncbi:hypothetical protein C8J56DRAFT_561695 [Mycena floridula]|nr:hypothetical protein C8J56DRAFT_561695 [Mycena floridula]
MNSAFDHVRSALGDDCDISDKELKDMIWELYFDVEQTLNWALDEQDKRNAARERRDPDNHVLHHTGMIQPNGRRLPLIVLAQQQQELYDLERQDSEQQNQSVDEDDAKSSDAASSPRGGRKILSTISERTERTEPSPFWAGNHRLLSSQHHAPIPSSATGTSFGRMLASVDEAGTPLDPNLIPTSPSGSAVYRLSVYEPAPSLPDSETGSLMSSPRAPSVATPAIDTIPDIPDYNSKSTSLHVQPPPKQSKLSLLASARTAPSSRSESSQSAGTIITGSVKTFPALRPGSQNFLAPTSTSVSAKSTTPSSMSSHVRRAIQAAIDLEAVDQVPQAIPSSPSLKSVIADRPRAPTPSKAAELPSSSESLPKPRQPSKLALLAQAKANSNKTDSSKLASSAKAGSSLSGSLAKALAAPVRPPPPNHLPPERTEILTPIANGPTVTTAITTSYQSLYSLTDPSRPNLTHAPFVVPLSPPRSATAESPTNAKTSKLAMKIKKAHEMQLPASPVPMEEPPIPMSTVFLHKPSRSRAPPSSFASLLVDDVVSDNTEVKETRRKAKGKQRQMDSSSARSKSSEVYSSIVPPPSSSAFSFDVPSPDDIVFNARKGTSVREPRASKPSSSKP